MNGCKDCHIFLWCEAHDAEYCCHPCPSHDVNFVFCSIREHAGLDRVIQKICMGEKILPDPSLGQDVAFLGRIIDHWHEYLKTRALGLPVGPHADPAECSTYYDGCHCTIETLEHNLGRLDKVRAALGRLLRAARAYREHGADEPFYRSYERARSETLRTAVRMIREALG